MSVLIGNDLSKRFGPLDVFQGVDLRVEKGRSHRPGRPQRRGQDHPAAHPGQPGRAQRRRGDAHERSHHRLPAPRPAPHGRCDAVGRRGHAVRSTAPPGRGATPAGGAHGRSRRLRGRAGRVWPAPGRIRGRRRLSVGAAHAPGAHRAGLSPRRAPHAAGPSQRRAEDARPAGPADPATARRAAPRRAHQSPGPRTTTEWLVHHLRGSGTPHGDHHQPRPLFPRPGGRRASWDLESSQRLQVYRGNYSSYVVQRTARRQRRMAQGTAPTRSRPRSSPRRRTSSAATSPARTPARPRAAAPGWSA
jgi:hypothetical protein